MLFRVLFHLDEKLAPDGAAEFFARRIMTLEWMPGGQTVKAVIRPVPFVIGNFGEAIVSCTPPLSPRPGQRLRLCWGTVSVGEATIAILIPARETNAAASARAAPADKFVETHHRRIHPPPASKNRFVI
jgi:hypothetical protein